MTAPVTPATPSNPKEWEEYIFTALDTPEKAAEAINSGQFKEMMVGYAQSRNKVMDDLKNQLTEQVSASVLEMFKKNGVKPDSGRTDMRAERAGAAYNRNAPGVMIEKIWKGENAVNSGALMLQDLLMNKRNAASEEARARIAEYEKFVNDYSPHVPSQGGFLIPEEVRAEIMTRALETAVVRPKATVVPVPSGKFRWPINDMTTEVDQVYGGIAFAWLDAGEEFPTSEAAFAHLTLEAHKLGGLASVPNELIRRISALETWLRSNMPNAMTHFEDLAFMKGNGVGKPLGGLHADNPALIVVGDESGQTSGITWNNVLAMFARLLPESYDSAEWDITPDAIPEIFSMALPVGTGGSAVMLGEGGGPGRLAQTMLGLPIRWTRKAPGTLNTQGDISLVDWSTYVIGDTTSVQLDTSEHSAFRRDKTEFRILSEVDGQPGMLSPLTPENGGPTLSAYIQLETRSLD